MDYKYYYNTVASVQNQTQSLPFSPRKMLFIKTAEKGTMGGKWWGRSPKAKRSTRRSEERRVGKEW